MKKKILYISDYTLDQYNSVRDILYSLIKKTETKEYGHIILRSNGKIYDALKVHSYENIKEYLSSKQKASAILKDGNISVCEKINYLFYSILKLIAKKTNRERSFKVFANRKYIEMLVKKEKPQLVVMLTYSPTKKYAEICMKQKIPYIYVLYDTYIGRPGVDKKEGYNTEKFVIDNSAGYYVPDFFYKLYSKTYDTTKVSCMNLPLLIEKQLVSEAYRTTKFDYSFTYFGQIQSFRNGDVVKQLFKDLNITLDIFSTEKIDSDDVFRLHPAVTNRELYNVVAGSKYLVAFDNSPPYQDYLPSKAYLYVSFTKPIIVFGNNENSALRDFLSNYPWVYYQNINESTEGLAEFLKKDIPDSFDESVYSRFSDYLPTNALEPIINNIKRVIG